MGTMLTVRRTWVRPSGERSAPSTTAACWPRITWLAARAEYAAPAPEHDVFHDTGWLLFGIGRAGDQWLDRLSRSDWFAGLQPRADDLVGSYASGTWTAPGTFESGDDERVRAQVETYLSSAPLPNAWCAAIAIPRAITGTETAAALDLVRALRGRQDPLGRHLEVIVTIDGAMPSASALTQRLREAGAFVVLGNAATGAHGDHLHHFPLRATINPREDRLICVDFADYLLTWRSGRVATLHTLPFGPEALPSCGRGGALNILVSPDPNLPDVLAQIDHYALRCADGLLEPEGDMLFTTADRLDGRTGWVDVLVVGIMTHTMPVSRNGSR